MYIKRYLPFCLILAAPSSHAYQYELNLGLNMAYTELNVNGAPSENSDQGDGKFRLHLNGVYHLDEVDTEGVPVDEAAFLGKSSSVGIRLNYAAQGDSLSYRFDDATYGKSYGMTVKAVVDDWILRTTFDTFNGTSNRSVLDGVDQQRLQIGLGRYVSDTTSFVISYIDNDDNRDFVPAIGSGIAYRQDEGLDGAVHSFMKLENDQAISYGGNLSILDTTVRGQNASGTNFVLGGNIVYYPVNKLTLKARLVFENFSDNSYKIKRHILNLEARYYFWEAFAMDFNLGHINGEDELGDVEGMNIGLGFRSRF